MIFWIVFQLVFGLLAGYCLFRGATYYINHHYKVTITQHNKIRAMLFAAAAAPIWLVTTYLHMGLQYNLLICFIFLMFMLFFTITDLLCMLVPNKIIIAALISGVLLKLLFPQYGSLIQGLWAALLGLIIMLIIHWQSRGSMGAGDAKLMAVCGLMLGWKAVLLVILLSSVIGAIFSVFLLLTRKNSRNPSFPYVPFIAIASWLVLNWQDIL
jgi:leader peptidase (prepilin peptidase)/N-methyltransferase